jgi:hypothetical protein
VPGIERKTPPPCPHEREFGEGVEWPSDVSLAHFDNCLTPDSRLIVWNGARKMADAGSRCALHDHSGRISLLEQTGTTDRQYIASLLEQLRELVAELRNGNVGVEDEYVADETADRLDAIIGGTRTQSVRRVL